MDKAIWQESTPEQKSILITLLMMANHSEKEWEWRGKRYKAEPGQFVTSLPSIVKKCGKGITIQNVRTALARFEKFEFLTDESTNRNRLITIVNWDSYQGENNKLTDELTSNQQATNRQLTANKNDKNNKNDKETYKDIVEYLNQKTNRNFSHKTKSTTAKINTRLEEGFTLDDFKKVIDIKSSEWLNDANMQKYLRPETLFGNKFEGYLNQGSTNSSKNESNDPYAGLDVY